MKKLLLTLATFLALFVNGFSQTVTDGRLSVTPHHYIQRDSLGCRGIMRYVYDVTLINSTSTDTVKKFDYPSYTFMNRYINGSGTTPWNFNANHQGNTNSDHLMVGDSMCVVFFDNVFICGQDTVIIDNDTVRQYWPNPCEYDTLQIYMYIDTPGTCAGMFQNPPVSGLYPFFRDTVYAGEIVGQAYRMGYNGNYFHLLQKTYRTGCAVIPPAILQFLYPNSPCAPAIVSFDSLPNDRDTLNFAYNAERNVDVSVWLGSAGVVRPTVPFLLFPEVFNAGYAKSSGQVYLVLDPRVTYNPALSNNPPASISGDTLMWNYTNLTNASNGGWWNAFQTYLHLTPDSSLNIGDTLCFEIFTGVVPDDVYLPNNYLRGCLAIVNSYDPNIKQVSPAGEGPTGIIPVNTSELTYTVHFQNTGNASAIHINVLDTLDANVDTASLELLGSTHNLVPEWVGPRVFKASFAYINLPDSFTNEPKSHGSFSYKIKLKPGLPEGTQIKNSAAIYFDQNAPIITNTTVNTLETIVVNGVKQVTANGVRVYPNPTNGLVNIITDEQLNNATVKLLNIHGQVVTQQNNLNGTRFTLNIETQAAGIYFVEITTPTGLQRIKLVKEF